MWIWEEDPSHGDLDRDQKQGSNDVSALTHSSGKVNTDKKQHICKDHRLSPGRNLAIRELTN